MKKLFALFIIQQLSFNIFAQSISVDPTSLQLPQMAVNPTCTVADKGKMIYNTAQEKVLYCNGTAWIAPTATPAPVVRSLNGLISAIPSGGGTPWTQAGPSVTVTVDGQQTITANMTGVFGHSNSAPQVVSFSACYQLQNGANPPGPTTLFYSIAQDATISAFPNKTCLSTAATVQLPAGTYKIFFALRNKSSVNLGANDAMSGTVIIF